MNKVFDRNKSIKGAADALSEINVFGARRTPSALDFLLEGSASTRAFRDVVKGQSALDRLLPSGRPATLVNSVSAFSSLGQQPSDAITDMSLTKASHDVGRSLALLNEPYGFHKDLFRMHRPTEIGSLLKEFGGESLTAKMLLGQSTRMTLIGEAIAAMNSPWLDVTNTARSIRAFTDINSLGHGVAKLRPFNPKLVKAIRCTLGDWRDEISDDELNHEDAGERIGFYAEQGMDLDITNFSVKAFHEATRLAHLHLDELIDSADVDIQDSDENFSGYVRAQKAFALLQKFEVAIRQFIELKMSETFGVDWMKRQLPSDMYQCWLDKKSKDSAERAALTSLIQYADFSDYRKIIERGDNWVSVFKPVFGRVEDVRESLQRLGPVRIATMHARIVTLEDEVLLGSEVRRVLKAIQNVVSF